MSIRIAHANIQISDPEASLGFYRHLGLVLVGTLRLDPVILLYVGAPEDKDGPTFELAFNPSLVNRPPGSGHLALAVGDLDGLLLRLEGAGIQPESEPFHPGDRDDLRVCFVRDPDSVRVELIDGTFPPPQDTPPDFGAHT